MECNDEKLNCTALVSPIQPDPDIAGYGVRVTISKSS